MGTIQMHFRPELRYQNIQSHVAWIFEIGEQFLKDPIGFRNEMKNHHGSVMGRMNPVLLGTGMFFPLAIGNIIIAQGRSSGVDPQTLDYIFHRFIEWGLVEKPMSGMAGNEGHLMQFNRSAMELTWSWDFVENICIGMSKIVTKYENSIPSIIVSSNGNENIGTGFLFKYKFGERSHSFVLTNKHVVDGSEIEEIIAQNFIYRFGNCVKSKQFDLAAIEVTNANDITTFNCSDAKILDEVVTVGYPKVSGAQNKPLLAHRGEINGDVKSYHDNNQYLAISCSVAPGNSGGPVLDQAGRVVGVVSESAIHRSADPNSQSGLALGIHHLAVPTRDIFDFLDSEVSTNYYLP